MPRPVLGKLFRRRPERELVPLYAASLFLMFHSASIAYLNSSYIEQYMPATNVGMIYTVGAALTVFIFLFISRVLHRVGNFKLTVLLLCIDLLAVGGMAFADSLRTAVPLMVLHIITVPLLIFNIDVFLEEEIGNNEGVTGSRRGLLLALLSFVGAIAPFFSGLLVNGDEGTFSNAYVLSAASLIPILLILLGYFKNFTDPPYNEVQLFGAIHSFWKNKSLRNVLGAHFMLQVFFVAVVVYVPLYLTQTIGLTWTEFGIIIFWAQIAYVLCEYPIGIIADKYIGEREMMGVGLLILALSTASFAFVTAASVVVWSIIMFISRVGASLTEVTTESYFFKQTKSSDAQVISFFRVMRPLSYVFAAPLASLALLYLPFNLVFVVIALLMVVGMFFTLGITDSK